MKHFFDIRDIGVKDKLLTNLKQKLWNQEVQFFVLQKKRHTTNLVLLTEEKVILFESNNETFGNATSYDYNKVKKTWKTNETKSKCDLFIEFGNNKIATFEFQNQNKINEFTTFLNSKISAFPSEPIMTKDLILEKMEKLQQLSKNEIKEKDSNQDNRQSFSGNPFSKGNNTVPNIPNPSASLNNLPRIYTEKPKVHLAPKPVAPPPPEIIYVKEEKIINDQSAFDDKTFSSKYITQLLSQKNTLLPNGGLTLIEKLDNKLNSLEMIIENPQIRTDVSKAIEVGAEVSNLKKRINQIELRNYEEEILNAKMYAKREVDSFSNHFNTQIREILNEVKANSGSGNVFNKINELKNQVNEELNKIKNISTDDRKFLEKTANHQKNMQSEIEKIKQKITTNKDQIFVTQKAWESVKSKIDDQLEHLENAQVNNELLNDIESKISDLASNIDLKDSFKKTNFGVSNKILAIDEKGHGAYFNIENFKDSIIDIIKENETTIYSSIEDKIEKVKGISDQIFNTTSQRFETIRQWYDEIKDIKSLTEDFKLKQAELVGLAKSQKKENLEVPNKSTGIIRNYKALSYSYKNEIRYGIRSGMKWSIEDGDDGRRGINSLYVDTKGNHLDLNAYDGIIFNNSKYYFNTPDAFSDEFERKCQFQVVKYNLDLSIDKIYGFDISKDSFIYTVQNSNGEIYDDRSSASALYDLKWLTFFKD